MVLNPKEKPKFIEKAIRLLVVVKQILATIKN